MHLSNPPLRAATVQKILTKTREQARQMKQIIEAEEGWGEVWLTEDQKESTWRSAPAAANMARSMFGGIDCDALALRHSADGTHRNDCK
ncbi:MAG: hypothetical protein L0Y71_10495 [Gemmataceae bacterium]|nr:hypothetical protein [Gemmataceae bacterium]